LLIIGGYIVKRKYVLSIMILLLFGMHFSCRKEFLDIKPAGDMSQFVLANEKGIETLLVGAYSMLNGVSSQGFVWESASSNWLYGSIRGMEANKRSRLTLVMEK